MQYSFNIIITEAKTGSWPQIIWKDAQNDGAVVYLNTCKSIHKILRKLRKFHFSNLTNKKIWLPLKCIWDWTIVLRKKNLDPSKRNYIIFQTGIKFSAHYIKQLKEECNACIVLYMPDNIRTINIANSRKEFERYCKHYQIDQVYSFDKKDCEEFGMNFFDIYSMIPENNISTKHKNIKFKVLYIGNCRSKERLNTLHNLYTKLKDIAHCTFYLNGVSSQDAIYDDIIYNHPLSYTDVIRLVKQTDIIIEIMNGQQNGNTLRFKEALCYNKRLLTNNKAVLSSRYYKEQYMQVFDNIEDIDLSKFKGDINYKYNGEFSPRVLMNRIIEKDINK